ncbi:hypothetical protein yruck0001_4190 [Yersinia ruckeri ATCC 29473]|uniref:Uncharacterized protein n=1 Tax=Yersinia ruckeri TaxID=29486 RepID=A0A0A8VKY5_YERRU|nr:hypothetical protein yruck0001_4190 [Yersinia ruckeri ATCC 29473]CEK28644.1 hypothetical protein CSF007_14595 [Yersinia ruckeri]
MAAIIVTTADIALGLYHFTQRIGIAGLPFTRSDSRNYAKWADG